MTTATAPPPDRVRQPLADLLAALTPGRRVLVTGADWAEYEFLLAARTNPGVRITYDRGSLELMAVTFLHERWKKILARLLEALCMGLQVPLVGAGNMTVRREDLERGFEPDECYYIRNAARVLPARPLDFRHDPPPDLAIEIEISRSVLDRIDLYATIGIPEIWRFDGERLTILVRTATGYTPSPVSTVLPAVAAADLTSHLARAGTVDDTTLCLELFHWAQGLPPAGPPA